MTVQDLIVKLQGMPPEAPVVIRMCSEHVALDDDEPTLTQMIERHGTWMGFKEKLWDYGKEGEPNLVTVCCFPGN